MNKEIELQFEMLYQFEWLLVTYYTEAASKNRLHSIVLNGTYPLDVVEITHEKQYADLKQQVYAAMANNSANYWDDVANAVQHGCPFDEPLPALVK